MNILHCFGKNYLNSLFPALAGRRFRLAGCCLAFSLWRWLSILRVVFGGGGWPNGMVQLLFGAVSLFAARGNGSGEGIGWFAAKRKKLPYCQKKCIFANYFFFF